MPKCSRCPIKIECNKAPFFLKTENNSMKKLCPLLILIWEFAVKSTEEQRQRSDDKK